MDTCEVKLTVGRAGPAGAQNRGDVAEVGLLEAGRMIRAGQCEKPDAKVLKAIAGAESAAAKETAAAAEKAAAKETAAAAAKDAE